MPLLRYQTGDIARLLDADEVDEIIRKHKVTLPEALPRNLHALKGRDKEELPNGSHVGFYKDILYADPRIAQYLTGACRLIFFGSDFTMHVQLVPLQVPHESMDQAIWQAIPPSIRPLRVVLWLYDRYPFGMGLDYERKFSCYIPGEMLQPEISVEPSARIGGGELRHDRLGEIFSH